MLYIPLTKPALATALALEWDTMTSTSQASKPHHVPLTSLINRALDIQDADTTDGQNTLREGIANMLMKYLETDSLLCWAPPDTLPPLPGTESLRESQIRTANAITQHLTTHIWPGIRILPVLEDENSLMPQAQPMMTQSVIRGWITGLSAFDLAGLERATLAGKSLCVGARLVAQWSEDLAARGAGQQLQAAEANRAVGTTQFGIMEASHAASLEVNSQIEKWGEVEDTHDVDREDVRRQMGSVILLVSKSSD